MSWKDILSFMGCVTWCVWVRWCSHFCFNINIFFLPSFFFWNGNKSFHLLCSVMYQNVKHMWCILYFTKIHSDVVFLSFFPSAPMHTLCSFFFNNILCWCRSTSWWLMMLLHVDPSDFFTCNKFSIFFSFFLQRLKLNRKVFFSIQKREHENGRQEKRMGNIKDVFRNDFFPYIVSAVEESMLSLHFVICWALHSVPTQQ